MKRRFCASGASNSQPQLSLPTAVFLERSSMKSYLLVLAAGLLFPTAAAAQTVTTPKDTDAVLVPINAVFAAFAAGDAAAMLRHVYPDGRVTASGKRPDGASTLRQQTWTQFAERITPERSFQERITDPTINIDGDIAM